MALVLTTAMNEVATGGGITPDMGSKPGPKPAFQPGT